MKIIVVPDSYKGCLDSKSVGKAIIDGITDFHTEANIRQIIVADGGEGTVDAIVESQKGRYLVLDTKDCFLRDIQAKVGVIDPDTAILEVANIVGLEMCHKEERDPLRASSYGVGLLIRKLASMNFRSLIIGLGGSSTNDGGMGLLQGLGVVFYDKNGQPLPCEARSMSLVASIDFSRMADLGGMKITVACDVTNRLLGKNGATYVFGPQKGVAKAMLKPLDEAMAHYAYVMQKHGYSLKDIVSGGAAGGMGAVCIGVLRGERRSGIDLILGLARFDEELTGDMIVISGEGRTDAQSACGKTIAGIAGHTKPKGIPLYIISGALSKGYQAVFKLGVTKAYALMDIAENQTDSMLHAQDYIRLIASRLIADVIKNGNK